MISVEIIGQLIFESKIDSELNQNPKNQNQIVTFYKIHSTYASMIPQMENSGVFDSFSRCE